MISGVTTSTRLWAPVRTRLKATCRPAAADEQPSPMSKAAPSRAERLLDLDGDRRIGPLLMRGRADHHVDVAGLEPGMVERAPCRLHAEFGHDGELGIVAQRNPRRHPLRVENAVEHQRAAFLDARSVEDELGIRFLQQRRARRLANGVLGVDPAIEARDQLVVGDRGFRDFDPDPGDGRAIHPLLRPRKPPAHPPDAIPPSCCAATVYVSLAVLQRLRQMPTPAGTAGVEAWRPDLQAVTRRRFSSKFPGCSSRRRRHGCAHIGRAARRCRCRSRHSHRQNRGCRSPA